MTEDADNQQPTLSDLPTDELIRYGTELGLTLSDTTPRGEVLRSVRQRQDLLLELARDALLDIVVWMRRPVRKSASKETLAREIARSDCVEYDTLSDRGLRALARLRGLSIADGESREQLKKRLQRSETYWSRIRRKRRKVVGQWVVRLLEGEPEASEVSDYRFLPEDGTASLRRGIEEQGVVGGIAKKLRGVADDYVREKLDEIEIRIDRKLDEIDERLGEWRDREVANRLRILKLTLIFSILVTLICLVYDFIQPRGTDTQPPSAPPSAVQPMPDGGPVGEHVDVAPAS